MVVEGLVNHTDDFASWDHPLDWYPRVVEQVLEPLRHNQMAHFQKFDWQANRLGQWEAVKSYSVVIMEGVSSSRSEFRPYLSFSIYIETDRDLRLKLGIEGDGEEILPLWQGGWQRNMCFVINLKNMRISCFAETQRL